MYCPICGKQNPDDGTFCASCGNVFPGRKGAAAATTPPPRSNTPVGPTVPPRPGETPPVGEVKSGLFAGRYELLHVLGKGGMGLVYRAKDRELGEDIAIKLLQPQFTKDAHEVERFKREILTARRITHPNVIRIHDYGTSGDEFFISMELLEGGTLADRIPRGIPLPEAVAIGAGIAEGLGAAHAKNVVHRDIKPHNVLFESDGTPKLVDFGIARFATATRATRGFAGTPHYISPEQAKGQDANERSDIYSLGVLLFELFTGKLPFDADSLVALAVKHAQEPPPPPRSIRADLPASIEAIVLKCLEKDPAFRYASAAELSAALRSADLTRTTIKSESPSVKRPGNPFPARPASTPPGPPPRPTPAPTPEPIAARNTPAPPPVLSRETPAPLPPRDSQRAPRRKGPGCMLVFLLGGGAVALGCGGLLVAGWMGEQKKKREADAAFAAYLANQTPDLSAGDDDDGLDVDFAMPSPFSTMIGGMQVTVGSPIPMPSVPAVHGADDDGGASGTLHSAGTWSLRAPSDWTSIPNPDGGGMMLMHPASGTSVIAVYAPGDSLARVRSTGALPMGDYTSSLSATSSPVSIAGGRGLAADYQGSLNGATVTGRSASVEIPGGVVHLLGLADPAQQSATRTRVDMLAASIQSTSSSPKY